MFGFHFKHPIASINFDIGGRKFQLEGELIVAFVTFNGRINTARHNNPDVRCFSKVNEDFCFWRKHGFRLDFRLAFVVGTDSHKRRKINVVTATGFGRFQALDNPHPSLTSLQTARNRTQREFRCNDSLALCHPRATHLFCKLRICPLPIG